MSSEVSQPARLHDHANYALMGAFQRKYSDDERTAVQQAYIERGIKPRRIMELAQSGRLTLDGEPLPAFDLTQGSARSIGELERKRRARNAQKLLAQGPPRDTVEMLRRRIAGMIDVKLNDMERRLTTRPSTVNPTEIERLGRALRELAALPGPQGEPAQVKRPDKDVNRRGSLAGKIRASARPIEDPPPVQSEPPSASVPETLGESETISENTDGASGNARADQDEPRINVEETGDPGEYVRAHIPGLAASRVSVRGA